MVDFAKALKKMRAELEMAQADLARELNVNVATISRWENGHNIPSGSIAEKILELAEKNSLSDLCARQLKSTLQSEMYGYGVNSLNQVPTEVVNQIINASLNAIYICDCQTYDLLYINETTAEMLDRDIEAANGKKCYEYLMHRTSPCPFCSMQNKPRDEFSEVEFAYPNTNRHFFMRGKKIIWNGREAHIEYVTEDTVQHYKHTAVANMVDCLPCGMGVFHLYNDGRLSLERLNDGFFQALHITQKEYEKYEGFHILEAFHPSDRIVVTTNLLAGMYDNNKTEFTVRMKIGKSGYQWMQVLGTVAFRDMDKTVLYLSFFNVDKNKKMEQQLQQMEDTARFLVGKGGVSIWIYNILENRVERLFDIDSRLGYPKVIENGPEEVVARGCIYEEDIAAFQSMYRDIKMGEPFSETTVRVLNMNTGKFEWQHLRMNRTKQQDGEICMAIGFCTNADTQKEMEARYRYESQKRQEQMKNTLSYYRINLTTRIVEERYSKIIDLSNMMPPITFDKLINEGILNGVVEDDRPLLEQTLDADRMLENYKRGRRTEKIIYRRALPEKGIHWIEGTISKVKRPFSDEIIAFYTTRDINRERKAQMSVVNVLEEETENIILLNPDIQMAQYIMDDGVIVNFEDESSYQPAAIFREKLMKNIYESDRERVKDFMEISTMRERLQTEKVIQCAYCVQSDIGQIRYKKARLFYSDDSKTELIYIQQDVTRFYMEEQRQREVLQATIHKELALNQVKSDFLKDMNYKLRTPLDAMTGLMKLTHEHAQSPDIVKENMEAMNEINNYAFRLVNEILSASQNNGIVSKLHLEPYAYAEFLQTVRNMFKAQYAQKGVILSIRKPQESPAIMADKMCINQIAFNLLSNALKVTPKGGCVEFTINNLKIGKERVWFDFVILDGSMGMPEESEDISLCVTRNLVNLMDGTIAMESEPGKGNRVTVHFSFEKVQ